MMKKSARGETVRIAVCAGKDLPQLRARAEALATKLGLPVADAPETRAFALVLVVTEKRVELREAGKKKAGAVSADFVGGRLGYRRRTAASSRQLLAKAVGFKGRPLRVVDATAGLGRDAFLLACLGCEVTAIERSPVMAALLRDGLRRAGAVPELAETIEKQFRFVPDDARSYLARLPENQRPEVVYIDPMFPARRKSALVKKEMRLCRLAAGDDNDAGELLETALAVARERVVVKRPRRAPVLGGRPTMAAKGTTVRYDVYAVD